MWCALSVAFFGAAVAAAAVAVLMELWCDPEMVLSICVLFIVAWSWGG